MLRPAFFFAPADATGAAVSHLRVWKFRPPLGRDREFANAYGSNGSWSELFRKARGYRGTTLSRPMETNGWWLTVDRWDTVNDFEAFQRDFGEEYRALDADLVGIAGDEEFVGAFEED
jgi:heme-degrading monooxygenase HmoA